MSLDIELPPTKLTPFRAATEDDIARIISIQHQIFASENVSVAPRVGEALREFAGPDSDAEYWEKAIADPSENRHVRVALLGESVVGFSEVRIRPEEGQSGSLGELSVFYAPSHFKIGLYAGAERFMAESGASQIKATLPEHSRGRIFFDASGFRSVERAPDLKISSSPQVLLPQVTLIKQLS